MTRYGIEFFTAALIAASLCVPALQAAQNRAIAAPPAAAADYYLKINGVRGESSDKNHKDWIDVLSYSWGSSNQPPAQGGSGTLTIVKRIDKSSPLLMTRCNERRRGEDIVVHLPGAGGNMTEYVLHDATVSSCRQNPSSESISLNFTKITMKATAVRASSATR